MALTRCRCSAVALTMCRCSAVALTMCRCSAVALTMCRCSAVARLQRNLRKETPLPRKPGPSPHALLSPAV